MNREKLQAYARELPEAIALAVLTAIATVVLILVLSIILGGEQRDLQRQTLENSSETVDSAIVARCELAHVAGMLRIIGEETDNPDLGKALRAVPVINIDGLDCDEIIREPFNPGTDYFNPETE